MYIKHIMPIISYGKYSKTFLNFFSETTVNPDVLNYINILKKKWTLKSESLLQAIDESLDKCKNHGIYYLLLSDKLSVLMTLGDKAETISLYKQLKKEFQKIPLEYRKMIGQSLYMAKTFHTGNDLKKFRRWSTQHTEDEMGLAVNLNAKARAFLKKGQCKQACDGFFDVSELALKYPHPTFILSGLNNASWYIRHQNLEVSHERAKKLAFHCGYWFDSPAVLMNYFDTLLIISQMSKDYTFFFGIAEMIRYYYQKMLLIEPECDKKYHDTIQIVKKFHQLVYNTGNRVDEIGNAKGLQTFLNDRITIPNRFARENDISHTSLYRIMKGQKKNVKIETLKGIFSALDVTYSFENPKCINHILFFINEESYLINNWKKVVHLSAYKLKTLILKTYMTLTILSDINLSELFKLIETSRRQLFDYIMLKPERITFISQTIRLAFDNESVNPYYKARYELANILFSEMSRMRHITPLFRLYTASNSREENELLSVYFRQYVRYTTTAWRFDVEEVMSERYSDPDYKKIAQFCRKINISEMYGYLCTWYFEESDRNCLIELITNLKN